MNSQTIGQPVYSADGSELGTVKEVRGAYFKVDAPMQPDYWLRMDACQTSGGRLVVMDDAEHHDNPDDLDSGAYTERTTTEHTHHTGTGHDRRADVGRERLEGTDTDETLRLREERLRVGKERERAGEVELGKRVVERTETAEVPLREERVVVERRPVNERADGGEIREADKTIRVPVERERAVADKETVVTEEVGVRKEAVERTQQVQGTVRKEELVTEGEGDLVEGDRNLNAPAADTYERERTRRD